MCGLVGMISRHDNGLKVEEFTSFEHSMVFNQIRGDDSTGLVCVSQKEEWSIIKALGGWKNLTRHARFEEFRRHSLNNGRLMMGHGRAATRGQVVIENAHPFVIKREKEGDELVLMHNGTLDHDQPLGQIFQSANVDSEWLAMMIAKHGAEKALSNIKGAIACMWWDGQDKTFNFYRNTERPLYFMQAKNGEFYLNSEIAILQYINIRFKLGVADKDINMLEDQNWHKTSIIKGGFDHCKIKKYVPVYYNRRSESQASNVYGYDDEDWRYTKRYYEPFPVEDKEFWDRSIETIEYINRGADGWEKCVLYRNKDVAKFKIDGPPEPDLIREYENRTTGDKMKVYNDPDFPGRSTYVTQYYSKFQADKKREADSQNVIDITAAKAEQSKDGLVRFTSRTAEKNEKVKHRAYILPKSKWPHLERYHNTLDGEIKVGDEVTCEVLYIDELPRPPHGRNSAPMFRVVASRLKPKQDAYIDLVFHSMTLTKQELLKTGLFKGTVGSLRLSESKEMQESGSFVIANLHNVKPAEVVKEVAINAPQESVH